MSADRQKCWWCKNAEADYLVDQVPICREHVLAAVEYQVCETRGADVRPLDWEPRPKVSCPCGTMFW